MAFTHRITVEDYKIVEAIMRDRKREDPSARVTPTGVMTVLLRDALHAYKPGKKASKKTGKQVTLDEVVARKRSAKKRNAVKARKLARVARKSKVKRAVATKKRRAVVVLTEAPEPKAAE
jgi:hypothetical protein